MFKKNCKKWVKQENAKPEFEVNERVFDYVQKTMQFTEKFLIEAIREKAAREGILICKDATPSWHGLNISHLYLMDIDNKPLSAQLTWREKIGANQ